MDHAPGSAAKILAVSLNNNSNNMVAPSAPNSNNDINNNNNNNNNNSRIRKIIITVTTSQPDNDNSNNNNNNNNNNAAALNTINNLSQVHSTGDAVSACQRLLLLPPGCNRSVDMLPRGCNWTQHSSLSTTDTLAAPRHAAHSDQHWSQQQHNQLLISPATQDCCSCSDVLSPTNTMDHASGSAAEILAVSLNNNSNNTVALSAPNSNNDINNNNNNNNTRDNNSINDSNNTNAIGYVYISAAISACQLPLLLPYGCNRPLDMTTAAVTVCQLPSQLSLLCPYGCMPASVTADYQLLPFGYNLTQHSSVSTTDTLAASRHAAHSDQLRSQQQHNQLHISPAAHDCCSIRDHVSTKDYATDVDQTNAVDNAAMVDSVTNPDSVTAFYDYMNAVDTAAGNTTAAVLTPMTANYYVTTVFTALHDIVTYFDKLYGAGTVAVCETTEQEPFATGLSVFNMVSQKAFPSRFSPTDCTTITETANIDIAAADNITAADLMPVTADGTTVMTYNVDKVHVVGTVAVSETPEAELTASLLNALSVANWEELFSRLLFTDLTDTATETETNDINAVVDTVTTTDLTSGTTADHVSTMSATGSDITAYPDETNVMKCNDNDACEAHVTAADISDLLMYAGAYGGVGDSPNLRSDHRKPVTSSLNANMGDKPLHLRSDHINMASRKDSLSLSSQIDCADTIMKTTANVTTDTTTADTTTAIVSEATTVDAVNTVNNVVTESIADTVYADATADMTDNAEIADDVATVTNAGRNESFSNDPLIPPSHIDRVADMMEATTMHKESHINSLRIDQERTLRLMKRNDNPLCRKLKLERCRNNRLKRLNGSRHAPRPSRRPLSTRKKEPNCRAMRRGYCYRRDCKYQHIGPSSRTICSNCSPTKDERPACGPSLARSPDPPRNCSSASLIALRMSTSTPQEWNSPAISWIMNPPPRPAPTEHRNIKVWLWFNKTDWICCSTGISVGRLKQMIFDKIGVPINKQYLTYRAKPLNDTAITMYEAGISDDSTVRISVLGRGGGGNSFSKLMTDTISVNMIVPSSDVMRAADAENITETQRLLDSNAGLGQVINSAIWPTTDSADNSPTLNTRLIEQLKEMIDEGNKQHTNVLAGQCQRCGSGATMQCKHCVNHFYCNTSCQRLDWRMHRSICPFHINKEKKPMNIHSWDDIDAASDHEDDISLMDVSISEPADEEPGSQPMDDDYVEVRRGSRMRLVRSSSARNEYTRNTEHIQHPTNQISGRASRRRKRIEGSRLEAGLKARIPRTDRTIREARRNDSNQLCRPMAPRQFIPALAQTNLHKYFGGAMPNHDSTYGINAQAIHAIAEAFPTPHDDSPQDSIMVSGKRVMSHPSCTLSLETATLICETIITEQLDCMVTTAININHVNDIKTEIYITIHTLLGPTARIIYDEVSKWVFICCNSLLSVETLAEFNPLVQQLLCPKKSISGLSTPLSCNNTNSSLREHRVNEQENDDITPLTINAGGLDGFKLATLLKLMKVASVDVLIVNDTRINNRCTAAKIFAKMAVNTLGAGTYTNYSNITAIEKGDTLGLGGSLIIVGPKWGSVASHDWTDESGLGLIHRIVLKGGAKKIQIIGTYWPVPHVDNPKKPKSFSMISKLGRRLAIIRKTPILPLEWIKERISALVSKQHWWYLSGRWRLQCHMGYE